MSLIMVITSSTIPGGHQHPPKYFLAPINTAFTLCCSPFRLVLSSERKSGDGSNFLVAKRSLPQSIVCAALTILSFLWMIAFIRISLPKQEKNPALYVGLLSSVSSCLSKIMFVKILWLNSKYFVDIANLLLRQQITGTFPNLTHSKKWILAPTLSILYTAFGFWNWAGLMELNTSYRVHSSDYTAHRWWSKMIQGGRQIFFVNDVYHHHNYSTNETSIGSDGVHVGLGLLAAAGLLHRFII